MNQAKLKTQQAYKLKQDLDRVEEFAREWEEQGAADTMVIGELADQENLDIVFTDPEPINSIDEIRMEGLLSDLENLDYILTRPRLPVMSERMLSVLESVKDFPHQIIPVVIRDTRTILGVAGQPHRRSDQISTEFVALQLLEQLDILDREKSDYDTEDDNPDEIEYINKLVLDVPESGLPPIFRIVEDPIVLYVSPEAKTALEEAEITGIRFVEINY